VSSASSTIDSCTEKELAMYQIPFFPASDCQRNKAVWLRNGVKASEKNQFSPYELA